MFIVSSPLKSAGPNRHSNSVNGSTQASLIRQGYHYLHRNSLTCLSAARNSQQHITSTLNQEQNDFVHLSNATCKAAQHSRPSKTDRLSQADVLDMVPFGQQVEHSNATSSVAADNALQSADVLSHVFNLPISSHAQRYLLDILQVECEKSHLQGTQQHSPLRSNSTLFADKGNGDAYSWISASPLLQLLQLILQALNSTTASNMASPSINAGVMPATAAAASTASLKWSCSTSRYDYDGQSSSLSPWQTSTMQQPKVDDESGSSAGASQKHGRRKSSDSKAPAAAATKAPTAAATRALASVAATKAPASSATRAPAAAATKVPAEGRYQSPSTHPLSKVVVLRGDSCKARMLSYLIPTLEKVHQESQRLRYNTIPPAARPSKRPRGSAPPSVTALHHPASTTTSLPIQGTESNHTRTSNLVGPSRVLAVVLAPSTEQAAVIHELAFEMCEQYDPGIKVQLVHGGGDILDDVMALRRRCPDILVATPGRLHQLLTEYQTQLQHLHLPAPTFTSWERDPLSHYDRLSSSPVPSMLMGRHGGGGSRGKSSRGSSMKTNNKIHEHTHEGTADPLWESTDISMTMSENMGVEAPPVIKDQLQVQRRFSSSHQLSSSDDSNQPSDDVQHGMPLVILDNADLALGWPLMRSKLSSILRLLSPTQLILCCTSLTSHVEQQARAAANMMQAGVISSISPSSSYKLHDHDHGVDHESLMKYRLPQENTHPTSGPSVHITPTMNDAGQLQPLFSTPHDIRTSNSPASSSESSGIVSSSSSRRWQEVLPRLIVIEAPPHLQHSSPIAFHHDGSGALSMHVGRALVPEHPTISSGSPSSPLCHNGHSEQHNGLQQFVPQRQYIKSLVVPAEELIVQLYGLVRHHGQRARERGPLGLKALVLCPTAYCTRLYRKLFQLLGAPALDISSRTPQERRVAALQLLRSYAVSGGKGRNRNDDTSEQTVDLEDGSRTRNNAVIDEQEGHISHVTDLIIFATDVVLNGVDLPRMDLVVQLGCCKSIGTMERRLEVSTSASSSYSLAAGGSSNGTEHVVMLLPEEEAFYRTLCSSLMQSASIYHENPTHTPFIQKGGGSGGRRQWSFERTLTPAPPRLMSMLQNSLLQVVKKATTASGRSTKKDPTRGNGMGTKETTTDSAAAKQHPGSTSPERDGVTSIRPGQSLDPKKMNSFDGPVIFKEPAGRHSVSSGDVPRTEVNVMLTTAYLSMMSHYMAHPALMMGETNGTALSYIGVSDPQEQARRKAAHMVNDWYLGISGRPSKDHVMVPFDLAERMRIVGIPGISISRTRSRRLLRFAVE
ncbi:hypothetical protein CEUSTIGMA_g8868.t1 [Chlamydomonas eustigma]|uniref:ATP-dependent RNA helicase n=1 Tax=Chlamydomonas eustigma TaxID=1157962 RepID=A0A250XEC6_9CHLO|nr:hypothetical protein CEUSTIGMA_g8868.t1 [Chlamydomonas eustigma]|eukprot:GAX81438.1 hypothetical protein CEUSTIGMA_g8868.t1 [Chlamydomonas eustigma]